MAVSDEERMRATRQETIRSKREHNLHRKFPLSRPFLSELHEFMTSVEGGGKSDRDAKQRSSDASRFLHHCNSEELNPSFLREKHKINSYITALKRKTTTAASTMKNILCSLEHASLYLEQTNITSSNSHKMIKKYLKKLKKSLNDNHRRRKLYCRVHRLQQDAAVPDLQDAATKMRRYETNVKRLIDNSSGLGEEDRNTVTSYLVGRVAIENASRPCHITNLTLEEFHSSMKIGDDYVATCTYSKNGIAPVTFSKNLYQLTTRYIRNIRNTTPGSSGGGSARVFVNTNGNTVTNVSGPKHLFKVLKLAGVRRNFTLTQLRKAITSKAVRHYSNDPRELTLFHGYLAHSPEVANMYYRTVNTRNEYHQGYQLVQGILSG